MLLLHLGLAAIGYTVVSALVFRFHKPGAPRDESTVKASWNYRYYECGCSFGYHEPHHCDAHFYYYKVALKRALFWPLYVALAPVVAPFWGLYKVWMWISGAEGVLGGE